MGDPADPNAEANGAPSPDDAPFALVCTHSTPVLPVRDVAAAQAHYRDVLGFTIDWRAGDDFGAVSAGPISLFLQLHDGDGPITPVRIVLNLPDADRAFAHHRARGATILAPLETKPHGMREYTVKDRDGHHLTIGHTDETNADYTGFTHGA